MVTPHRKTPDRVKIISAAVFAVALLVRLFYLYEVRTIPLMEHPSVDARAYHEWGLRIAMGDWWGDKVFYQAPAYPYLLGVLFRVGGHSLALVHVVQMIIGASSCVLIYLAGRRFFDHRAGLVSGLMLALYAPAIFMDGLIQKASLALFLTCLVLYLVARTLDRTSVTGAGRYVRFALCGAATSALALTRENMLFLLIALPVWMLLRVGDGGGIKRRLGWVGGFLLGAGLILLPVVIRNYSVGSVFVLTTSQLGSNFYIGNNPDADGLYAPLIPGRQDPSQERRDAVYLAEQALGRELSPKEVSDYWFERGMDFVRQQPAAWLAQMLRKVLLTWNHFEFPDAEDQSVYAEWSWLLRMLGKVSHFGVIAPLGVAGVVLSWRHRRRVWLLYLLLALITASVAFFFVFARYRFPLVPVLILLAGAACVEGRAALGWRPGGARTPRGKALAAAVSATAATALVVNWPMVTESFYPSVSFINLGRIYAADGRMEEAERHLAHAIDLYPDNAEAYHQLGKVMAKQNRLDQAKRHLRKAATLDPAVADTHSDLAGVLARQGRADQAIISYREALRLKPDAQPPRMALVVLLVDAGERKAAVREMEALTALDPRNALLRLWIGQLFEGLDLHREAQREFRAALRLDSSMEATLQAEGVRLTDIADDPQADPESAAGERTPGSFLSLVDRARRSAGIGRFAEAIEDYQLALGREPEQPVVHYELASAYSATNRLREAAEHYQRAIEQSPRFAEAHIGLGQVYAATGDIPSAIQHYRLAVEANPRMIEAHYNLATALADLERFDEAIVAMQRCLELATSAGREDLIGRIADRLARLRKAVGQPSNADPP